MKNRILQAAFVVGVVCTSATSALGVYLPPRFSLKAVKLNDQTITPTNEIGIRPGDVIETEIRISGWAKELPGGARAYSAKINCRDGATSGDRGTVLPVGWNAPLDPVACWEDPSVCDADQICNGSYCLYPGHNPAGSAYVNRTRTDYIFYGLPASTDPGPFPRTLYYTYFDLLAGGTAIDTGAEAYAGTLKLVASPDACGTFTYDFVQGSDTALLDEFNVPFQPVTEPLIIHVGNCAGPLVFSLKAVSVNDVPLEPTNVVSVESGDLIETEIRISGWGGELPGGARSYTARIAGRTGATSGGNGTILPGGWFADLDPEVCWPDPTVCDDDEICNVNQRCVYPGHNPASGAFIDAARSDFLFYGLDLSAQDVATNTLDYTYFSLAHVDTVIDDGSEKYAGTLRLVVSEYACGTFTYGFVESTDTSIADKYNVSFEPIIEPLIFDVWPCPPPDPWFNCKVDAGIPHNPDDPRKEYGLDALELEFDVPAEGMTCSDFLIRKVPPFGGERAPRCDHVETSGNVALIHLSGRIPLEKWTCILHYDSGVRACIGYLPGDSDGSLTTDPDDAFALAMNLDGDLYPSMLLVQCDVDRSHVCGPLDILSAIDLLNGAEAFEVWEGAAIPEDCPTR